MQSQQSCICNLSDVCSLGWNQNQEGIVVTRTPTLIAASKMLDDGDCQEPRSVSKSPKLYIGAVAEKTGLTVDTIRFYEKEKLLKTPARTFSGYRLYGEDELRTLRFITKAQRLGLSLHEIRQLLEIQRRQGEACGNTSRLIKEKLVQVEEKIRHLSEIESLLNTALKKCNHKLEVERSQEHCPVLDDLVS
jgi:DNA-binding transcriptional MerR regulator